MTSLTDRKRDLETLQGLYAHWERGDFSYTDAFTDDVVWAPRGLEGDEVRGEDELRKSWSKFLQAWENLRIRAVEVIPATDSRYVVMQVFAGTGKSSGVETEGRTALVITMRDGKIARMDGFWDRGAALREAGLEQ